MINFVENSRIDKFKWDACIFQSCNKNLYANSWYLDVVKPDWNALVDGDYEAIMPLTWKRKYGVSYLYQPYFTQQLGIFSRDKLSSEKINQFMDAIPSLYKFIEINLNIQNKIDNDDFEKKLLPTHLLNLNQKYDSLALNYSENLRRNIAKAKKNNLHLNHDVEIEDIIDLFRENRGKEVSNFKNKDYQTLKKLSVVIDEKATLNSLGVVNEKGALLAGAIFPEYNGQAVFLFSGLSEEGKEKGAMAYLIDSFIRAKADQELILDFEGSANPNLARFYKSFGSEVREYCQIKRNLLPKPIRWLKK